MWKKTSRLEQGILDFVPIIYPVFFCVDSDARREGEEEELSAGGFVGHVRWDSWRGEIR